MPLKRLLALLLSAALLLPALYACSEQTEESGDVSRIAGTDADALAQVQHYLDYYKEHPFTSYREVAAVYALGVSFDGYDLSALEPDEKAGTGEKAGAAIAGALLEKAGVAGGPDAAAYAAELAALSEDELAALDTETLCDVALALLCTGQAHDPSLFVDELESRQVRGGGIAAVKPVSADDVIVADPDATASAMTVFAVYKSRTDGTIYDNTLMYIYNTADEIDASFADLDGKKSAVTTAKTLVALLCAGVSFGGSLCANIKTTLDTFRYEPAGYFAGMRAHQGGAHSEEATAECFLAFAFSVYGPTWVKLAE